MGSPFTKPTAEDTKTISRNPRKCPRSQQKLLTGKRRNCATGGPTTSDDADLGVLVTERSAANCQRLYFEWVRCGRNAAISERLIRRMGKPAWDAAAEFVKAIDKTHQTDNNIASQLAAKVFEFDQQIADISCQDVDRDEDFDALMATFFQSEARAGELVKLMQYWSEGDQPIHQAIITQLARMSKYVGDNSVDRTKIPILLISSISGGGKTEVLNGIADFATHGWDNNVMTCGAHHLTPQDLLEPINKAVETLQHPQRVNAVVVLAATFNSDQSFSFDNADDVQGVMKRVIWRMAMNLSSRRAAKFRDTDLGFRDFAQFANAVRKLVGIDPKQVVVIYTVDEIMKITNDEVRKRLLSTLSTTMVSDISQGFPTFVIVSSLQVEPIAGEIVVASGHSVMALRLPPLPVTVIDTIKLQLTKNITDQYQPPAPGTQIARGACVAIDICSGHFRTLQKALDHYSNNSALTAELPTAVFFPVLDSESELNVAFFLLAVHIATGKPLKRSSWIKDAAIVTMLLEGKLQFRVNVSQQIEYSFVAARWLLGEVGVRWWPLRSALCNALYLSDNQSMTKGWESGMLAVMFFRAVACQWFAICGATGPEQISISPDDHADRVTLAHVFGDTLYQPSPNSPPRAKAVTFYSWKGEAVELSDYFVTKDLLHWKNDKLFYCPQNIHDSDATERRNSIFVVGTNRCHRAIEALTEGFCHRGGVRITLLFQNKLREKCSRDGGDGITQWIKEMHDYAQNTLHLVRGTYLNILFLTGVTTLASAAVDCEGTVIVPPQALTNMLEEFNATILKERVIDLSRSELRHDD